MFILSPDEKSQLTTFLAKLIRIRSVSSKEDRLAQLLVNKLREIGVQNVSTDRMGNVIARIGNASQPKLLYNGHMDTVDVTNRAAWDMDPWKGLIKNGNLYGIGASDMKASIAAMVYGVKKLLDNNIILNGELILAFVVQEEPCEGMAMQVLVEEEGIRPDMVILGEPTNMHISRGQRGRVELRVVTRGRSSHAAQPETGENAIYSAMRLIFGIELLSGNLANDRFLGSGSLSITQIHSDAPSRNAVPDTCSFYIDRRLTLGETETRALAEIQSVIMREGVSATVEVTEFEGVSYTGYKFRKREVFPSWALPAEHPLVQTTVNTIRKVLGRRPDITRWAFSTDGVYTMGQAHIPTIGFGPGNDEIAHAPNEHVRLDSVHQAAEIYAQFAVDLLGKQ
ncbi:MAG: YgeY family selenium metabolism-linked hydrolase [Anaerolineales bacterium]|nr:YgeY family selenium metabolism-linked hydrolase [Anaerolineales bacterium]